MAAVTEDDNAGELPVAGDEATGAAAAGELAGQAGDQDGAAQPDARAGSADAAAAEADAAPGVGEDEAPGADEDEEAPEEPSRDVADLEQESEIGRASCRERV